MSESKSIFTPENFIKGGFYLTTLLIAFFNLREEVRRNKIEYTADKEVLEFRISQLEKGQGISLGHKPQFATIPEKPKRYNEEEE